MMSRTLKAAIVAALSVRNRPISSKNCHKIVTKIRFFMMANIHDSGEFGATPHYNRNKKEVAKCGSWLPYELGHHHERMTTK
jgi:hypothetical protein